MAFGLLSTAAALAQDGERAWGISPYFGLYQPRLDALNKGEFRSPYEGFADFIDPVANNTSGAFLYESPLPPLQPGSLAGLEVQWRINERHALILGVGTWEAVSSVASIGNLPIEGNLERTTMQRKAGISYTEYFLGWRYDLFGTPGDYRFYVSAVLHQIYDLDYREDFTNVFTSGIVRSFRKTAVIEAQATGLALVEGNAGVEWFFADWLSFGVEGGYRFGFRKIELGDGKITTDVLATDNISIQYPLIVGDDGRLKYKAIPGAGAPGYKDLELDFSGWKAVLKATVYY